MKKAQIQNWETVTVVVIVIIMIVVGIWIGFGQKISSAEKQQQEDNELDAVKISFVATQLEEIRCSTFSVQTTTCLDKYRLRALNRTISTNQFNSYQYYYSIFKNSEVIVHVIYPEPEDIVVYRYVEGQQNKSSIPLFTPILVYDPVDRSNDFGMLEVRTFS